MSENHAEIAMKNEAKERLICEDCDEEFNELRDGLCGICNVKADEAAGEIPCRAALSEGAK